jgi:hypothetical protein
LQSSYCSQCRCSRRTEVNSSKQLCANQLQHQLTLPLGAKARPQQLLLQLRHQALLYAQLPCCCTAAAAAACKAVVSPWRHLNPRGQVGSHSLLLLLLLLRSVVCRCLLLLKQQQQSAGAHDC